MSKSRTFRLNIQHIMALRAVCPKFVTECLASGNEPTPPIILEHLYAHLVKTGKLESVDKPKVGLPKGTKLPRKPKQ